MEILYQTLRSDGEGFDSDFAEFLGERHGKHVELKKCTFYSDNQTNRKWAFCLFER
jgi:hypothetical protein